MDSSENESYKNNYYKGAHHTRNMMPQQQVKKPNALAMNKKIMAILTERDTAIRERNIALAQKKEALTARDEALQQRDEALAERDTALKERDNAIAALQVQDHSAHMSYGSGRHGTKRVHHSDHLANEAVAPYNTDITNAFPITAISSEAIKSSQRKLAKGLSSALTNPQHNTKKDGDDLNRQVSPEGKKYRSEWESQDAGLNLVNFDETSMPTPVCSCTGAPRQCYKWGNGGWQSSCCTTTMSMYPLPPMPNKRHARVGGRKMSGSVFTRLLSRLAAEGHDLSLPVDLKVYWARHGTNRYITIK